MIQHNQANDEPARHESPQGTESMALAVVKPAESPPAEVQYANSTLTAPQAIAVQALAEGASFNDAARAAGVERNTLYRWRTRNAQFIAAMNAWRRQELDLARDQFLLLRDAALAAVRQGLANGDSRLGMAALDRMGVSAVTEDKPILPGLISGPELEMPEAETVWRSLEQVIGKWPAEAQLRVPHLFDVGVKIANNWGMKLLDELADANKPRFLSAADAKVVPHLIVSTFNAAEALLDQGGIDGTDQRSRMIVVPAAELTAADMMVIREMEICPLCRCDYKSGHYAHLMCYQCYSALPPPVPTGNDGKPPKKLLEAFVAYMKILSRDHAFLTRRGVVREPTAEPPPPAVNPAPPAPVAPRPVDQRQSLRRSSGVGDDAGWQTVWGEADR